MTPPIPCTPEREPQNKWTIPDYLKDILHDDPAIATELLALFIEDTTANIRRLHEHLLLRNEPEIGKILHSLKGSSLQIGAANLSNAVEYVDTALSLKGFSGVNETLIHLNCAFESVRSEIESAMAASFL